MAHKTCAELGSWKPVHLQLIVPSSRPSSFKRKLKPDAHLSLATDKEARAKSHKKQTVKTAKSVELMERNQHLFGHKWRSFFPMTLSYNALASLNARRLSNDTLWKSYISISLQNLYKPIWLCSSEIPITHWEACNHYKREWLQKNKQGNDLHTFKLK